MKSIPWILLILLVSINCFGQSKRLNKLLEKYAFTYASHPPFAKKDSKEIVVPFIYNQDLENLQSIKWKDIDSIRFWDTGGLQMDILLYGKGSEYQLCDSNLEKCETYYFGLPFKGGKLVEEILIRIESKSEDGKLLLTKSDRKNLEISFRRLNNTPIINGYPHLKKMAPRIIEPPKNGIIVYLPNHIGEVYIPAKEIQEAKELMTVLSTYKIVSYKCYLASLHNDMVTHNDGEKFNMEILKSLYRVRTGAIMVFDEILVENGQGKIEKATTFMIVAK